ncbi:T9SS type A sorting domain-containing protein [Chryseobacterium oryzae]|uniref:T9SS type A sorting domain-containing protein n=1 Tax=Chryseobacterium oryzae TaxID=2929799 RepID=A0ABY4BKY8_9FLAO|nr:T9SS type A sorting domain-containing protein [Chryseobacterium oryzae]UOE39419.1 T9SS type A sorting domain-containing protein [Chryseobacterium oryzae]
MQRILQKWCAVLVMLPGLFISQTYQWQWAKQAGGQTGSGNSGFTYTVDESIRDVVVDSDNNTYYLAKIWNQGQNVDGTSVPNYGNSDLIIYSTDCQGILRWSTVIGGTGNLDSAWNIEVDNNGGVYLLASLWNEGYSYQPTSIPTHLDNSQSLPAIVAMDATTQDAGFKTSYLLKYNSSTGSLIWNKPLQGNINFLLRQSDSQMMCMDSSKNIHAILGFKAGTHLDGLITVPSSFTNTYQYYLVKFNYNNTTGNMTPATPVLLPITGSLYPGLEHGKVNMVYDEGLSRYYLAGTRGSTGNLIDFSFNNISFTKEAYLLAFNVNGTIVTEAWRKEIEAGNANSDEEIHSIIKDTNSSDIYISGRYFSVNSTATFGNYTFPTTSYNGHIPFVVKLNSAGNVLWSKIADGAPGTVGNATYGFMKGRIVQNGNEIGFAHGSWGSAWGSYNMTRPSGDRADPILVRLNKDSGAVLGMGDVLSNQGTIDEFTAITVDNDGNYVLGGFFHQQLFTDANDNVPTMAINVTAGKSQNFFTKYAKTPCSNLSVEETSAEAGLQFYPNPVQDFLTIKSKNNLESYEVYSSVGQSVLRGRLGSKNAQINMSGLTAGVYYVKVKTEKAVVTEKVVKR